MYLIRFSNAYESFIKVGITTRNVAERWGKTKYLGYKIELLYSTQEMKIRDAHAIEQKALDALIGQHYVSGGLRTGNTECFIDTPEIVSKLLYLIEQESNNND